MRFCRLFNKYFCVLVLLLAVETLSAQKDSLSLLYCREDLQITALYPINKSNYLVTDYGFSPYDPSRNVRNLTLRLIGSEGLSKDSITFDTSIREIIPIADRKAIVNGHSYTYTVGINAGRLVKEDSVRRLDDFRWIVIGETKGLVKGGSLKDFKRSGRKNSKKTRGISVLGVYYDWVILEDRSNNNKQEFKGRSFYVVNKLTNERIRINPDMETTRKGWDKVDKEFHYWKRSVFFIDDDLYFSHPETGRCYIFDTKTKKVEFFSFPDERNELWFFTYDYVGKKSYLVNYSNSTFNIHLYKSVDEELVFLKQVKRFDNYIYADRIVRVKAEKGYKGEVACFYYVPIYEETKEWE